MMPLCIYHGGCDDGFGAAWAVRKALGTNVEFYPGVHQEAPPKHAGRDIIFVDFSYRRSILDAMAAQVHSILILDHHKTAAEDLADLSKPPSFSVWRTEAWQRDLSLSLRMTALFDMNRSGAALAWDFFNAGPRPDFIEYIQDADLWRKSLPDVEEFTLALRSYLRDFDVWDGLATEGVKGLVMEGRSIRRYYRLRVEEMKQSAYMAKLDDCLCWVANAPIFAASEVAGDLAERGLSFGVSYVEFAQRRFQYSLRSRGDFDVSLIARHFGGGGHKNAAGFTVDRPVHEAIKSE